MKLAAATFHNYRTLRDAVVPFGLQTVLVGANNAGKSSVLDALDSAFGLGRRGFGFGPDDVAPGVEPSEGLSVLFEVRPGAGATEFTVDEVAFFGMHVDVSDAECHRLFMRAIAREEDDGVFRSRMWFQKSDGLDDGLVGAAERQELGFLLLHAVRDGRREFQERSGLWAKLATSAEVGPETASELGRLGEEFAGTVLDKVLGKTGRAQVASAIGDAMGAILYAGDASPAVTFTLVPVDPAETVRAVEIRIGAPGDPAPKRVADHSIGTQSVAVVGLFSAYMGAVSQKPLALGIEEPEAHLHPHATRALVRRLGASGLQTIISTHSTTVTDAADPRSVVVLRRQGSTTTVAAVRPGAISDADAAELRRRMAEAGTEFMFARVALITEGPSERAAFPVFAAALGFDLDVLGVSIAAVGGGSFKGFIKLLGPEALDIPYVVVCDNDDAAMTLLGHLRDLAMLPPGVDPNDIAGSRAAMQAANYFYWSDGALEKVLLDAGGAPHFDGAIEQIYPGRLDGLSTAWGQPRGDHEFLMRAAKKVGKPQVVRLVAERMVKAGLPVPPEIEALLVQVREMALHAARAAELIPPPGVVEEPNIDPASGP